MLAQAVLAAYEARKERPHGFSVTSISSCPYGTYINYKGLDRQPREAIAELRMEDGHWQERECLAQLEYAGFQMRYTGTNQLVLTIGEKGIKGRPDGLIWIDSLWDLLEIKAMSLPRYTLLKQKGLAVFPSYKCQIQLYMASNELRDDVQGCRFYAKHKDSCRPYDFYVEKDLAYADPIIEEADAIVSGHTPEKPDEPIPLCAYCSHKLYCWKHMLVDTSGIKVSSLPEAASKWKEGKVHKLYGQELLEEAREGWVGEDGTKNVGLIEELGESNMLLCEDLKVQRIMSKSFRIDQKKFVEIFGANRLSEVAVETVKEQIRITEV